MALRNGEVQGSAAIPSSGIDFRTVSKEKLSDSISTGTHRYVQRRVAVFIDRIYVGTFADQHLQLGNRAPNDSFVQLTGLRNTTERNDRDEGQHHHAIPSTDHAIPAKHRDFRNL